MINAEGYYTSGEQKKKYVLSNIQSFLKQNNISISDEVIDAIIESVIKVSKSINK
ncbi:phage holin, LLH family [Paracholeplasma brassicae]|uniref:phage holin, LLH family n=1 Tax=Acholeplasma brassicae TaxID=61635 RepID=UPI0012FED62A